ncbi:MAG: IPT/TIG domain-containing protein [Planctomycetes bacterium]|nr:IPT/TIG domain-containing protein [Planctomycetota bacterium]
MSFRASMLTVACAAALAPSLDAHVRLITSQGYELRWGIPAKISIVINQTGSDNITDGSHVTAIQNAIRAWNQAPGSAARLIENTSAAQRARTDWPNDNLHLVYFDENGSSGYFPNGTGIVAITPVWFTASGVISDADILFNGRDFNFTTRGAYGCFDVQDIATHEIGHLLGLDHSGWAGATMYPYVDTTIILHRSLSMDDVCGLRAAYPSTNFGSLSGVVRRSNDSFVEGAHVVARDAFGRPFAASLTSSLGFFTLRGLPVGDYTVYATPLDQPVSAHNLSGPHGIQTNFQTTVFGSYSVPTLANKSIGNVSVAADTTLALGRTTDDFPLRCILGRTRAVTLHGAGLAPGSTLECSDPGVTITPIAWNWSQVSFDVTIPPDAAVGHVDLTAVNASGERSTLVAGLEITPPDPTVTSVTPSRGSIHGGEFLTIRGTNFGRGAQVVLGAKVYDEGVSGGCTVVDSTTIQLTTVRNAFGVRDVIVIDKSGVEGRLANGYEFRAVPSITTVFPSSGYAAGGTVLVIRGQDFIEGCTVSIDGVVQTAVQFASSSKLVVTTSPGIPGGPYDVEVRNPLNETANALFMYWSDPDPIVQSLDPASGPSEGGSVVTVHGANFTATCDVYFGADPDTGLGGALAGGFEFIDADTLRVVAPAFAGGARSVIVRDAFSNQAGVAAAAFEYQSPDKGGGGCAMVRTTGGDSPFRGASGFAAIALACAWLAWRARAARHEIA